MSRHLVLFTGGALAPEQLNWLAERGLEVDVTRVDLDESELREALRDKDAYILGGVERASAEALSVSDTLKVIAFLGVGYHAFVDADAATSRGIAITNAPGANARAVAEFAIGLLLDAWRRLTYLAHETKAGNWPELKARNLEGKTLGVVGMGTIGSIVARIATHGLGMRVVYTSRSDKREIEQELRATRLPLDELLSCSDVVTLHASFGPETQGMLDAERLARLKPEAVLVNTSEAELVDPVALREALVTGKLASVAMDGYYIEPVPAPSDDPHGLLALPHDRVLVTPHTANATAESLQAMLSANADSIVNVLETGTDDRIVNPEFRRHATWLPAAAETADRA